MLTYKMKKGRIPCLYEISYRKRTKKNSPCIVLRLHEEFVEANKNLVPLESFIKQFQIEHGLGKFSPLSENSFGFNGAIKKKGKDPRGFIVYEIEIPILKKDLPELCERCGGTGWDEDLNMKCLSCRGKKHPVSYNWKPFHAISASLHILGIFLNTFNKQTSAKNYQLLAFKIFCGKEMDHFPIGGYYGRDFCDWLNSVGNCRQFYEIIKEMEGVYSYIYNGEKGIGFQLYIGAGAWLIISVPGNACGIDPTDNYIWAPGKGREFSCHNMDNPVQQIMILVALAILSDMARESMKG